MPKLPEPPKPIIHHDILNDPFAGYLDPDAEYTAEQVREYALAYGAIVREECAKAADGYADSDWIGSEGARRAAAFIRKDTP